jgi:hypothetical protein
METPEQAANGSTPVGVERVSFDEYMQTLPASRRSAHRWLGWVLLVAFVGLAALLAYAVYASIAWKSVGGLTVMTSWLYFALGGAVVAILLGIDTLVVRATIPPPFQGSRYDFITGGAAIRQGLSLVVVGVVGGAFIFNMLSVVHSAAEMAGLG